MCGLIAVIFLAVENLHTYSMSLSVCGLIVVVVFVFCFFLWQE